MKVIIDGVLERSTSVLTVTEEEHYESVSFSIGAETVTVKRNDVMRALQAVRKPQNSLSDKLAGLDKT